jgi:urease accessory protein
LPFLNAAHAEPQRLAELDQLCDGFTLNHVANRASRVQGKALRVAVERIFGVCLEEGSAQPQYWHLAPVFGALSRALAVPHGDAVRLFVFFHLRGVIAAAMRLNIVGPMEGQAIQFQLSARAEAVAQRGATLGLEDLAQTTPLLDLWQGAHDRLYSRLFQS